MHINNSRFNGLNILAVLVLTCILSGVIFTCFSPGFMSYDSLVQYQSALDGIYSDNHPALMAYIWHLILKIYSKPGGLLFFHELMLFLGILVWAWNLKFKKITILIPLIFFCPWIINFAGVLWKDVGMAFGLFLGASLIFNVKKIKLLSIIGTIFLFYAFALRHNSIFAIVPILFFAFLYLNSKKSFFFNILSTLIVIFGFYLASSLLSNFVLDVKKTHFETFLMGDDIAQISSRTGQNLLPWVKREDIDSCSIHLINYERALCFIDKGYDPSGSLVVGVPPGYVHSLWLNTVLQYPVIYLTIRREAFIYFLRSPQLTPYSIWQPGIDKNDFKIKLTYPNNAKLLESYINLSKDNLSEFFKPYFWLLLCMVTLLCAAGLQTSYAKMIVFILNLSSIFYFLGYFISVPSADFRYIYWCIISISLSLVFLINGFFRIINN